MPRLPTYTAEVSQYGSPSGRRASSADFFDTSVQRAAGKGAAFAASAVNHAASLMSQSPVGEGLQQLGSTVRQVAEEYVVLQERRDVADQQVQIAKTRARLSERLHQLEQEGELGIPSKMDEILQEEAEMLRNSANTRAGTEAAERGIASLSVSVGSSARAAEAKIFGEKVDQDSKELRTSLGYTLAENPDMLPEAIDNYTLWARNVGLPKQEERALVSEGRASLAVTAAGQQIQDNPVTGKALVEKGIYDPYIDVGTKQGLIEMADRAIESNRRAAISDIRGLIEDDLASIRTTGQGIPGLENQVAALGDSEFLQEYRESRAQATSDFAFLTESEFAPPEQVIQMLEARRPAPGTEGFADKQKTYESLRKVASEILTQRADDPFLAASRDSAVSERMEQAEDNPVLYEAAVAANLETQAAMGIPPPARRVMSETQAAQIIAEVENAPTVERSVRLNDLLGSYGRYKRQAMAELQRAGMNPQVFGLLNVNNNPRLASTLAEAQTLGREELKKGMPEDFDEETLKADVQDKLSDLQAAVESVPGRVGVYNQTILEPMIDAAMLFERRGQEWDDEMDSFLNQFEIYDTFYIPRSIEGKPVNVGEVEAAAEYLQTEQAIREFKPATFGAIPEGLNVEDSYEAVVSAAVNSGFWATNGTGDGLQYMLRLNDGSAVPLVNNAGERYTIDMMNPPSRVSLGDLNLGEPTGVTEIQ